MATVKVTEQNFEELIKKDGIVIIDFWAGWCRPCMAFAPTFEAASEKHTDITFAKCDTEEQQGLAGALGIRSIPTLMIFRDNVLIFNQPGMLPAEVLEDVIQKVSDLDMEEVRADIAKQEKEHGHDHDHDHHDHEHHDHA